MAIGVSTCLSALLFFYSICFSCWPCAAERERGKVDGPMHVTRFAIAYTDVWES